MIYEYLVTFSNTYGKWGKILTKQQLFCKEKETYGIALYHFCDTLVTFVMSLY